MGVVSGGRPSQRDSAPRRRGKRKAERRMWAERCAECGEERDPVEGLEREEKCKNLKRRPHVPHTGFPCQSPRQREKTEAERYLTLLVWLRLGKEGMRGGERKGERKRKMSIERKSVARRDLVFSKAHFFPLHCHASLFSRLTVAALRFHRLSFCCCPGRRPQSERATWGERAMWGVA